MVRRGLVEAQRRHLRRPRPGLAMVVAAPRGLVAQ